MSATINIDNYGSANLLEPTTLGADITVATDSISVENNDNISASDNLIIGGLGSETAEKATVESVSGSESITLSADTKFEHAKGEPVNRLFGTQIKLYRAANSDGTQPADSAFAAVGSAHDIDFDQPTTLVEDATGGSDYWYKFTYYNGTSETRLADSLAVRGGDYGNYCTLDDVRDEAGFKRARYITNAMIDVHRQAAKALVDASLNGIYVIPFAQPVNPLIRSITRRLAAGYLLLEQYGHYTTQNTKNGQSKIDGVTNKDKTGDLDKLINGSLTLTDTAGNNTELPDSSGGFRGHPNASTKDAPADEGGGGFLFQIGNIDPDHRAY